MLSEADPDRGRAPIGVPKHYNGSEAPRRDLKALLAALLLAAVPAAHALEASTDNQVYSDGLPLFVYGTAPAGEDVIVRLVSPDRTIQKFDQVQAGPEGRFWHVLMTWPPSSVEFPYGTYTVEVISADGESARLPVAFSPTTELEELPVMRQVNTLVYAPETSATDAPMRIFVQVTSDGLLVGQNDPASLLRTSHVHLPDGRVVDISGSFETLHSGLYFVDYTPDSVGTYVFHVVSFHQGSVSHGSAAATVLSQDIGGISDEISELDSVLHDTSDELRTLKSDVAEFDATLNLASSNIESGVESISESVLVTAEASSQLNSLLIPVVTSIGIIVALQVAILARRR